MNSQPDNWPGSEMGPPEKSPIARDGASNFRADLREVAAMGYPHIKGGQGRTASSVGWNAMALMGMCIGVGLVALAFNYRWLTMALGVAVIVVAMVAAIAMPEPAKSKHIDTRG